MPGNIDKNVYRLKNLKRKSQVPMKSGSSYALDYNDYMGEAVTYSRYIATPMVES